ncbi:MAG TPA: RluA family pseudouridine synthase [Polyangiaceae bacterium]|nr:RluA family pseudouridine synthase [Polyangiaceae bacterium]
MEPGDAGARVEQVLMRALRCTRGEARALCEQGRVTLDGHRARKGDRAVAGAEISVSMPDAWLVAEPDAALDLRLERPDLVVVSKPAGMPSAPLSPGEGGTLVNALIARYPEMCAVGWSEREPGLVHRLDTHTSGLLLAARTTDAFQLLVAALRAGQLEKRYAAVVPSRGLPDEGTIDAALHPDPSRSGRVSTVSDTEGYRREAKTTFRVLERGPRWALVEARASRAFRHQVRVHLASIGHPICGDALYGGAPDPRIGAHHALHASTIGCDVRGLAPFRVEVPPPAVFLELLQ